MAETVVIAEEPPQDAGYRFSWSLAIAGGVAATAVTFILLTLGAGFGLLLVNPVAHTGPSMPAFLTGGAIYFFVAQAFGFAVGGHLAGRLLAPIVESAIQEEFRAAAHGFVAWAVTVLATLVVVAFAGATAIGAGTTIAALYGAPSSQTADSKTGTAASSIASYRVDVLFRPANSETVPTVQAATPDPRGEARRILEASVLRGEQMTPEDRSRLVALVAQEAGIPESHSASRVDRMIADVQEKTRHAADIARKAVRYTSLWIAMSLLFGAIVAVFAAMSARLEDDRDEISGQG
jgi:hypothetical protein